LIAVLKDLIMYQAIKLIAIANAEFHALSSLSLDTIVRSVSGDGCFTSGNRAASV